MQPFVLFDLDGTLVDSLPDLTAAMNTLFMERGLEPITIAAVQPMVGDGVKALVERAFLSRGRQAMEADVAAFTTIYTAHAAGASQLFPGIPEVLEALQEAGWGMAVCTNKPAAAARSLLKSLNVDKYFSALGTGDSFPTRKPDPAHITGTLKLAGAEGARAVMVGDHRNDVMAARAAGLPAIFAAWGYGTQVMGQDAAAVAMAPKDLPHLLAGWR